MSEARIGSRALFETLAARAYLNHAAVAPPSRPVREAVRDWMDRYAKDGMDAVLPAMEQRGRLKAALATLLGCRPEDLGITSSTSRGLMELANAIPLGEGDRILCFEGEFPTNHTPWATTARACGATVDLLPQEGRSDGEVLEAVEGALRAGWVRLIAVSAVQFSTGRAMPVGELARLAHAHGAEICVDAIQAVGVMPLDVGASGIDYLAGGAHKWLMGIEGVGYLYAHPERAARLRPRTSAWLSHVDPIGFLFQGPGHLRYDRPIRRSVDVVEAHSLSVVGCAALEAALGPILHLGVPAIQAHVRAYLDALEAGLCARGFTSLRAEGSPSGILALRPPEGTSSVDWTRHFNAHGVAMSGPDGKLRFAPHWPNALDEVGWVLEVADRGPGR